MGKEKPLEILVVDDNEKVMTNVVNTLSEEYTLRLVFDLEGAMEKLKESRPDYIITDLCFHERGLTKCILENERTPVMKSKEYIRTLNRSKSTPLEDGKVLDGTSVTSVKRVRYDAIDDSNKIGELFEIFNSDEDNLRKVTKAVSYTMTYTMSEESCLRETERRYKKLPPMGYYVIKEAQKEGIPFIVVTGWAHGEYFTPVLAATGIETLDDLLYYKENSRKILDSNSDVVGYVLPNKKVIIGDKETPEVYKTAIKIITQQKKD